VGLSVENDVHVIINHSPLIPDEKLIRRSMRSLAMYIPSPEDQWFLG